jgi:hypothetical protein
VASIADYIDAFHNPLKIKECQFRTAPLEARSCAHVPASDGSPPDESRASRSACTASVGPSARRLSFTYRQSFRAGWPGRLYRLAVRAATFAIASCAIRVCTVVLAGSIASIALLKAVPL